MSGVKIASLHNPADCREAAELMREGKPVGVYGRSVASIWVDPTNEEGVKAVYPSKEPGALLCRSEWCSNATTCRGPSILT